MEILNAAKDHIQSIISLAEKTWYATYISLVPLDQIVYMLDLFYKAELLNEQMLDPKHHFLVMVEWNEIMGYSHCIELENKIKLSKLYFSPEVQGKGLGKRMMESIEKDAKQLGFSTIELCVNRGNPAQHFYERMGFSVLNEIDIPIGDYFMNDYLMQKQL